MYDPIQASMLGVQALAFVGLVWYVVETRRMRKAAQEQIRISQDLINAAMDQVEGMSKPCLTLWSELRDTAHAISSQDGALTSAKGDQGSFVVQNIGNGVALNVSYRFAPLNVTVTSQHSPAQGYVQNVLAGQKVTMKEYMASRKEAYEVIFQFQSIGGRKYQTTVTIDDHVLRNFVFGAHSEEGKTTKHQRTGLLRWLGPNRKTRDGKTG